MYAVIKYVNGTYSIAGESFNTIEDAKVFYHGQCQALWNEKTVLDATVAIVMKDFKIVDGCIDYITHTVNA